MRSKVRLSMKLLGAPASRWRVALHWKHQLAGETPALPGSWALHERCSAAVPAASCGSVPLPARKPGETPGELAGGTHCATVASVVHGDDARFWNRGSFPRISARTPACGARWRWARKGG